MKTGSLRRDVLAGLVGSALLGGCAMHSTSPGIAAPAASGNTSSLPVIVFVHGNGDSASIWQTTLWRFESNGWPRSRLHAIDVPYPLARDDDSKVQPGRTSTTEHMNFLASEVKKVLAATGATQLVLMGNSRGGYAIRNFIANGGGDKLVSHAILGGVPNHGVWAIKGFREANEFAGTGPFLTALNAPRNASGDEVSGPVKWMTIRSDGNDKFAQPDGVWIGAKGTATNINAAGPELKGATNIVLAKVDHRETSFSPLAFATAHQFITGTVPTTSEPLQHGAPVLNGKITGLGVNSTDAASGNFTNNLPLPGARLDIFELDASTGARRGTAVHSKLVGADGHWGPFMGKSAVHYEFVITAAGYAITHYYRSPFPRSSDLIHLRAERLADADKDAKAVISMTRPRGYFDVQRDPMSFDSQTPPPGLPPVGAGLSASKIKLGNDAARTVVAKFRDETVVGQTWSAQQGHVVFLEITQ